MEEKSEVYIGTRNAVQLTFPGEKGEYSLSIPLNSQINESLKVCWFFIKALEKEKARAEKKKCDEKDGLQD